MAFLPLVGHFTTPFRHSVGNHRADLRKILNLSARFAAEVGASREMACVYGVTALVGTRKEWLFSTDDSLKGKGCSAVSDKR